MGWRDAMKCKRCDRECEHVHGLINWRERAFWGYLCRVCNALYTDPEDDMLAAVAMTGEERRDG
jgi:hypothetical protein